ncbi:MAG: TOBE domain-containing protein, partial [Anaerococcus sp.]|nr:TOBE domain-containing protein [Anaerococcus sp.]
LIDVEVLKEDDGIYVKNDYIKLKLPEDKGRVLEDKNYIGKKVVFGIRPESLYDDDDYLEKTDEGSIIEAKVRVYELMGAEVYLYFDLGDDQITARVKPSTKARVGENTKFAFDMEKSYLFDPETKLIIE